MPRWLHRFEVKPGAWVFVPDDFSRATGEHLKSVLTKKWAAPAYFAHLKSGGHVKAIKRHTGDTLFIRADIQDFFGCINRNRVTRVLKGFMPYKNAREFAKESVLPVPNDRGRSVLPFGFVQSPIIASICLHESTLGAFLARVNGMGGTTVTVYMDDIIVSTSLGKTVVNEIFDGLQGAAEKSGFPLNKNKLVGPSTKITAFNIDLSYGRAKITSEKLEDFAFKILTARSPHVAEGIFGYTKTVSVTQANALKDAID